MLTRRLCILLVLSLLPPVTVSARESQADGKAKGQGSTAKTIAIGDVHGDYATFFSLLLSLKLVDDEGRWTGQAKHLVQTGDLLDRGAESRKVIELLMRLEGEAPRVGGRVTVLLGNHEAMNLTGDLYYADPGEIAAFASDEDAEYRREMKEKILDLLKEEHGLLKSGYYQELGRLLNEKSIDRIYAPGYFAHRRAFSPDGRIGKWLLERGAVHVEDDVLFVHGGISPRFARFSAEEINRSVRESFDAYLKSVEALEKEGVFVAELGSTELRLLIRSERAAGGPHPDLEETFRRLEGVFAGPLFAEDGPLWYRGLAEKDQRLFGRTVRKILELQQVKHIVIGHTQPSRLAVTPRFDHGVIMIDTGMNQNYYKGRPSALVILRDGSLKVFAQ